MSKPKVRYFCAVINRPKMLFETKEKADRFIEFNEAEIKSGSKKKFKHLRSYYCESCGGWHITSLNLTKEQIENKDKRIKEIIDRTGQPRLRSKLADEEKALEYIKTFDLLSFGSKKKARKYFTDNRDKIPTGIREDKVFRILKNLPIEYFTTIDLRKEEISKEEIDKEVSELYNRLPFHKLTDNALLLKYIEWEFQYKEKVRPRIIIELKRRLNLL